MSQSEPLISANSQSPEQTIVSPAVAEIMERAHKWAGDVLERFKREQTGVVLPLLSDFNAYIGYMLGTKEANPADFSQLISLKKQLRSQEAANDSSYKTADTKMAA